MRDHIHNKTIEQFSEKHFNEIVVDRTFENKQTKEVYHDALHRRFRHT